MNAKNKESLLEVRVILLSGRKEKGINYLFLNYLLLGTMGDPETH